MLELNHKKIIGILLVVGGLALVIPYITLLEPWIICIIGGYLFFKGIDLLQKHG
jgi:hypothetical protein